MRHFIFIILVILSNRADAFVESFQYGLGFSQFLGDLSHQSEGPTHSFQMTLFHSDKMENKWRTMIAIEVLSLSAEHTQDQFPFDSNENLNFLGFFFIPTLCYQNSFPISPCFGIGQGTLNVNGQNQKRDYGTWSYHLSVPYPITESLSAILLFKYIGDVEQTVDKKYSKFSFYNLGFALNWKI